MDLQLIRDTFAPTCTIGRLGINGVHECWTLEDFVRPEGEPKVPGRTAIPYGRYEIMVTHSQRFNQPLPILLSVPGFLGVRIHPGNTDADTEGCILVGRTKGAYFIGESKSAFALLFLKIQQAINEGKVFISIEKASENLLEK